MSKESLLKKDFTSATKVGAGYSKTTTFYKEGDITFRNWEDKAKNENN